MWDGVVNGTGKSSRNYVWLVRGTLDHWVILLPRTGQTTSYASGDDGDLERGVAWPDPRFQLTYCDSSGPCGDQSSDCDADPSNDVVYDSLTDRTLARDANLPGSITNWQGALDYVDSLNGVSGLCGKADWHLPNRKEQFSLVDYSQYDPALQTGYPFVNVQLDYLYWSGTSCACAGTTDVAWDVYMWNGLVHEGYKSGSNYVWPVRAGQVDPSANSNISVTKSDDSDPVFTGGELTYTVTITNNGPDDATGVTLTDMLPGSVTFVSATPIQGTCVEEGGIVTCNIGNMLIDGDPVIVTIIVTAPDAAGAITNTAEVACTSFDLDPSNNTVEESTIVQSPEPSIEETIDFFDEAVEEGTITGSAGWIWGQIKLNIMRQHLTRARFSIERGYIGAACWRLRSAYRGCDGEGYDWIVGEDAGVLAQMIYDLAVSLDCWWTGNYFQ